jgi:hypothetical protein
MKSNWNRSARKSGGDKAAKIHVPRLTKEDAEVMIQVEKIRQEFGEDGVRKYWEMMEQTNDRTRST